jgi:hypothetical protein
VGRELGLRQSGSDVSAELAVRLLIAVRREENCGFVSAVRRSKRQRQVIQDIRRETESSPHCCECRVWRRAFGADVPSAGSHCCESEGSGLAVAPGLAVAAVRRGSSSRLLSELLAM